MLLYRYNIIMIIYSLLKHGPLMTLLMRSWDLKNDILDGEANIRSWEEGALSSQETL